MTKCQLARSGVSGMMFVLVNALVAGCAGITTAPTETVQENLPIPTLVNNVPKPRDASLALQEYCGHLGIVDTDGIIETLRIPVYAAGNAPKLIVPSENSQADYHSLLDRGAAITLTAAYGPASGNYALDAQDRLARLIHRGSALGRSGVRQGLLVRRFAVQEFGILGDWRWG